MAHEVYPRKVYFYNPTPGKQKILFSDGSSKLDQRYKKAAKIAFSRRCCCDNPCFRIGYVIGIGSAGNDQPLPGGENLTPVAALRRNSRVIWHYHIKDTYQFPPGTNYHNHYWGVEYCYDPTYDIDPADLLDPPESFRLELYIWACGISAAWELAAGRQDSQCFAQVDTLPQNGIWPGATDYDCYNTWLNIRSGVRAGYNGLTNCQWTDEILIENPIIRNQEDPNRFEALCPECECDTCGQDCPELFGVGAGPLASKFFLIEIGAANANEPRSLTNGLGGYDVRVLWNAHVLDTRNPDNPGENSHTEFWAIQLCYDPFSCDEQTFNTFINNWLCETVQLWIGEDFCSYDLQEVSSDDISAENLQLILDNECQDVSDFTQSKADCDGTTPIDPQDCGEN
jgi:hypothetical protein